MALLGPAARGSKSFKSVTDTQSARDIVVDLFATYFPEDAALIEQLQPLHEDPALMVPRRGHTDRAPRRCHHREWTSGSAIGDAAISFDPIGGQGAQTAVIQAASLVRALKTYDGKITYKWLQEQFEKHWNNRGDAATEVTRLFLSDPKYATQAELLFPAAAVNVDIGTAFLGLLSEPRPLLDLQSREAVLNFISDRAGESGREHRSARFKSPQAFTTARSLESALAAP